MDWLPSKEIFDLVITVTKIKHIQRSRGREDLQEITSDNVVVWPRGKYKCELRFKKRQHVYNTSSAFSSPFCNTAKLRDNTKSKLLKDILNGAQKTSPTSFFSLSCFSFVFKEYIAEHSSSSCPSYSFSCTHLFLDYRWIFLRGGRLLVFGMLSFHSSEWRVWLDKGSKWLCVTP